MYRFSPGFPNTTDPDRGWDGIFSGRRVSSGTYIWMAHYTNTIGKRPVLKKGPVMVIR